MSGRCKIVVAAACLACVVPAYGGGWVNFVNETSTRLVSDPGVGAADPDEKDYAWADLDQDGDIDLVCVRKNPFTSAGGRRNVLFMNEGVAEGHSVDGVLVDRTADYAVASSDDSQGFLDLTNDRDVVIVDVDGDGWLDMVTATTIADGLPKTISHPRVYMNLGEVDGEWQGFYYDEPRTPQIYTIPGGLPVAPRFCAVAAGLVTDDAFPDLYFADYDASGAGGVPPPPGIDVNDRLWVNDGTGFFTDSMETRMNGGALDSRFGTSVVIADMNGDGVNDICKDTGLQNPRFVSISYNDPNNEGYFPYPSGFSLVYELAAYFISVGDLNGNGLLDMVVADDGNDRYLINQGNDASGHAEFNTLTFPAVSNGFGGNIWIADLNQDTHNDVLITDVDVDIPGCTRRMHIYRNLGNAPNVSFQEQGEVIPSAMLNGTHDVAVFDLNGDDWLDLVVGRCNTTEIWINEPPVGITYMYPSGLPAYLEPNSTTQLTVELVPIGGGTPDPATAAVRLSVDGSPFLNSAMTHVSGNIYTATLPAVDCTAQIRYYFTASLMGGGGTFTDPPDAPGSTFLSIAAEGTMQLLRDEMETGAPGWEVISDPSLSSGEWVVADPIQTVSGGVIAQPGDDATQGLENVNAFITGQTDPDCVTNCEFLYDVDGGPTYLLSPVLDLTGTDATISFTRWFFSDLGAEDIFVTQVSNDPDNPASWVTIDSLTTDGTNGGWETVQFVVSDWVPPSATVRVRFVADDTPNDSVTEAGIDNFQVDIFNCPDSCPGDVDGTGDVGFSDLLVILGVWGDCPVPPDPCPGDFDESGDVGFADLLVLLGTWGPCP